MAESVQLQNSRKSIRDWLQNDFAASILCSQISEKCSSTNNNLPSASGMENFSQWGLPQWVTDVKSSEAPLCSTKSLSWHCSTLGKAAPCTGASLCAALHWAAAAASGLSLQQSSYWGSNHSLSVLSGKQKITVIILYILWDISTRRFQPAPKGTKIILPPVVLCSCQWSPAHPSPARWGMEWNAGTSRRAQHSWTAAVSQCCWCMPISHTSAGYLRKHTLFVHIEWG